MTTAILHDICTACTLKDQTIATMQQSMIDPGFQLPVAGWTLKLLQEYAAAHPGTRVSVYKGDIDNLKQINTATGSQARSDELLCPAWSVRNATDLVVAGKTDAGDGLIFVFSVEKGPAAITRIQSELRNAPLSLNERRRYVLEIRKRHFGPLIGYLGYAAYRLGWPMRDYLGITIAAFEDVAVEELERIFVEDRAIFAAKAAGQRGGVLR